MATWFIINSSSFRVKPEGKGLQERKVDPNDPLKSLEELETKVGLKCPDEKKNELLNKLQSVRDTDLPSWLQNVSIPEWYSSASTNDVSNALRWGCELVQEQKRVGENKLHDHLDLQWKKVVEEKQREIEEYKAETERLLSQKEKEVQNWKKQLYEAVSATGIETKLESAKREWQEDQKKIFESIESERKSMRESIEYFQSKLNDSEEKREKLQTKLEHRDAMMNKSAHKGQVGEDTVEMWLKQAFYSAVSIENTTKETGKMDFHVTWEGLRIMVDVKNHDGRLHSKHDVDKFHNNLRDNPDMSIGILLCTSSRVPNHNRFWVETEFITDKQLAIYMNHVSENPIERLQLIAGTILQPWKDYLQLRQKVSEMVAGDELRSWSDKARCTLLDSWSRMMKLHELWIVTYNTVHKSLEGFQETLFQMVQDTQSELHALDIGAEISKRKNGKVRT